MTRDTPEYGQNSYTIYLHIPFCRQRCSYCVFNTYTGLENLIPAYFEALCREISWMRAESGDSILPVKAIYFGGGTPSMLPVQAIHTILAALNQQFEVSPQAEITFEANPGTVSAEYLSAVRRCGVNRLSFGAQSAQEQILHLFNRDHDWQGVVDSVSLARQAGFDNLSLDLIYGVPNQTIASWQETLKQTLALAPEHLSMYSLSVEPGAAMHVWVTKGTIPAPDSDLAADMYELASDMLVQAGFEQYEISNWARGGYECVHNLQYWRHGPYLGIGAGAAGFAGGVRYANIKSPWQYIKRLGQLTSDNRKGFPLSPAVDEETIESVDLEQARAETMMLGLRLTQEGVSRKAFARRFGRELEAYYADAMKQLDDVSLLELLPDRIRLTSRARLLGNYVFSRFV